MALYLTKLLDKPRVLYSNVGGLSGFVKGKKSDICAYTDSVPRFRADGMQLVGSLILFLLFFLTGIWPTFSLWTFLPSWFYKTPVKNRGACCLDTGNHPSWCTSLSVCGVINALGIPNAIYFMQLKCFWMTKAHSKQCCFPIWFFPCRNSPH